MGIFFSIWRVFRTHVGDDGDSDGDDGDSDGDDDDDDDSDDDSDR